MLQLYDMKRQLESQQLPQCADENGSFDQSERAIRTRQHRNCVNHRDVRFFSSFADSPTEVSVLRTCTQRINSSAPADPTSCPSHAKTLTKPSLCPSILCSYFRGVCVALCVSHSADAYRLGCDALCAGLQCLTHTTLHDAHAT